MNTIPRKIVIVFVYLPNFNSKMEFNIGKIVAIPATRNNSDLFPNDLELCYLPEQLLEQQTKLRFLGK